MLVGNGSPPPSLDFSNIGPPYFIQRYLGGARPTASRSVIPLTVDPTTGAWYLQTTAADGTTSINRFLFGLPGWKPGVGDFDGSGTKGIGTFDPSTGTWYLRPATSSVVLTFAFGAPGWIPLVGDWDGNGTATVGVVDPSVARWFLRKSNSAGGPDTLPVLYSGPGWFFLAGPF